ncbi:MAG: hypothetical protein K8Q89_03360 [Nitrosarchaeum sp.]|nr:hypothetical protein [Nitrosarchaeum sp.]
MALQSNQHNTNSQTVSSQTEPIQHNEIKNKQAYSIALIVIIPFIVYFGTSLFVLGIESTKEMTALLGGYVATVLVYFFGKEQSQSLSNQVKATTDEKIIILKELDEKNKELKTNNTSLSKIPMTVSGYEKLQMENENNKKQVEQLMQQIQVLQPLISALCNNDKEES